MVGAGGDVGAGAFGGVPLCVGDLAPPLGAGDGVFDEFVEACGWNVRVEDEGPAELFGFSAVACGVDELLEEGVGDGVAVDAEGVEGNFADGAFGVLGEGFGGVGAHEEGGGGEGDHAGADGF